MNGTLSFNPFIVTVGLYRTFLQVDKTINLVVKLEIVRKKVSKNVNVSNDSVYKQIVWRAHCTSAVETVKKIYCFEKNCCVLKIVSDLRIQPTTPK